MSEHQDNGAAGWPPTLALQLDDACLRFEEAWKAAAGKRPLLEQYLASAPEAARPGLLHELLALELTYRYREGEVPSLEEFTRRFPDDVSILRAVFAEVVPSSGPAEQTATASATSPVESSLAPPGYEVLGELGRGGMGVVYKARQAKPSRLVALKMVPASSQAGPRELRLFRQEAQAAADLQHPNIVPIYEVGEHNGLPFFSMELCAGGSLSARLDAQPLTPREAAALLETLARAVHAAHEVGIIHRDLKPANIVLASGGHPSADGECEPPSKRALAGYVPKITDFGLARRLDADVRHTQTGAIVGTPSYMAPEQVQGKAGYIGPATDIYGLGAVLYELLTGRPPFQAETVMEILEQVVSQEPLAPRRLNPGMARDLETVCLKCLHKEPSKRYASALELAEDLRRFLAGEPIVARPVGRGERLLKWATRRPTLAAVYALLVLGLGAGGGGAVWQWRQAEVAREQSKGEKERADREAKEALLRRGEAERAQKRAEQSERAEQFQRQKAEFLVYLVQLRDAQAEIQRGQLDKAEAVLRECDPTLRHWEHAYLLRQTECIWRGGTHTSHVSSVAFSADGKRIVSGSGDKTVKVWDAQTGQQIRTLKGHTEQVTSVALSADGKRIVSGSHDRTVKVWDAQTGQEMRTLKGHTYVVRSVALSANGKRIVSGSGNWGDNKPGEVKVWDAHTGQETLTLKEHSGTVHSVAFSADGTRIASGSEDKTLKVWDAQTGQEMRTLKGHTQGVQSVAFSADGKRMVSGSWDGTVKVWDAQTGQEQLTLQGHTHGVLSVAFSADGKRIVSGSHDQTVKVWDADTGQKALSLQGHTGRVWSVAFSADGKRIVLGGDQVEVWDAHTGQEPLTLKGHTSGVTSVAFSADGKRIVSGGGYLKPGEVKVWDAHSGQEALTLKGHTSWVTSVAFFADGKRIVSGGAGIDQKTGKTWGEVKVWDAQTGQETLTLKGHTSWVTSVTFSADGKRIVSAGSGDVADNKPGEVKVWDAHTGQETLTLKEHTHWVNSVAFSADGKRIASGSGGLDQKNRKSWGEVKVWDAHTGQEQLTLKGHTDFVTSVAFSADGKRIASGSQGYDQKTLKSWGEVKVWDAQTGQETLTLKGHTEKVNCVAFSADGKRIVSGSGAIFGNKPGGEVKVWNAQTGQEAITLKGHTGGVNSVAFSPDGKRIVSGNHDRTVKVWDASPVSGATDEAPARPR